MQTPKTDLVALARLVTLSPLPKSALWQTVSLPGDQDWRLIALLDYDSDVLAQMRKAMSPRSGQYEVEPPVWLAQIAIDVTKTNPIIWRFDNTYDVANYAKSPLLNGFATFIDEEKLLIVMTTQ